MAEIAARSAELAGRFHDAVAGFRALVEALTPEQWRMQGVNHPTIRVGDEDEGRPVGVIAYHTAASIRNQVRWVGMIGAGEQPPRPERGANARQAEEHAGVTKEEVLALLDEAAPAAEAMIRGFTPDQLERRATVMIGEVSLAEVVERIMVGHVRWHQGSIEATIGS